MQRETIFQLRQFAAIEIVAADGTTDMGQMHTDLMGAPGFQPQADEAMLDLLSAMMEARASGRQDLALRSLDQAEQYLRMLGVQSVFYDAEHAALFDVLPARSGERTVRPALVRDGELVRRGVAASRDQKALEAIFEESPAWRSYCELEARRLKESYFLDEEKWAEAPLCRTLTVCYDEPLALELSIGGASIRKMVEQPIPALGGRSFVGCLKDALCAAVEVSRNCPPEVVILTGGASRMAFFQQACREAFADALVVLCPEPECSIARGLAYAGRVDERLKTFRQEVASIAHGEKLSVAVNASAHELYEPVAKALFDIAQESTLETVKLWRKGGIDTIEELNRKVERKISKAFAGDELCGRIEDELHDWLDELMRNLENELTTLCVRCGVPPERMSLTGAKVDAGLDGVKLSLLDAMGMDILSGLMGVVLAVVGASVCGGGGVALVGAGPVGMIAGAAAGILLALVGKSGMEKALVKAKLPLLVRKLVTDNAVKRGLSRQREEIEKAIIKALADPANGFSARLCQSLSQTLGAQMERMARDAEMSICA